MILSKPEKKDSKMAHNESLADLADLANQAIQESNRSMSHSFVDANMISFENPIETLELLEETTPCEIKFVNNAFSRIVNRKLEDKNDFESILDEKFIFYPTMNRSLSLKAIANSRFSKEVLGQVHQVCSAERKAQTESTMDGERLITFRKHEIIFEDKTCVMLNAVDVSDNSKFDQARSSQPHLSLLKDLAAS